VMVMRIAASVTAYPCRADDETYGTAWGIFELSTDSRAHFSEVGRSALWSSFRPWSDGW